MTKRDLLFTKKDRTFSAWTGVMAMALVAMLLFAGYFGFFYKNAQAATKNCEQYYENARQKMNFTKGIAFASPSAASLSASEAIRNLEAFHNCKCNN